MQRNRYLWPGVAAILMAGLVGCGSASTEATSHTTTPKSQTATATHSKTPHHAKPLRFHGTVTALGSSSITLVTKTGLSHTFNLSTTTKIMEKKAVVPATDLKTGEVVTITEKSGGVQPIAKVVRIIS